MDRLSLRMQFNELSQAAKLVLFITVAFVIGSILKSYHYATGYGNVDLRTRVIGARLLHTAESPYFFKWSPRYSDRLLISEPNNENNVFINGISVAPGLLYVQSLFSWLHYSTIQKAWAAFQYLLIGYIFFVFLFHLPGTLEDKFLPFVVGAIFFLCSPIWFINIERGQSYVLFAFAFCVVYQLYLKEKPASYFLAGIIIALAAYCRPTFIVVAVPVLIAFNRWTILGIVAAAIPLAVHAGLNIDVWTDYRNAMAIYTGLKTDLTYVPQHTVIRYPAVIEGMDAALINKYKADFPVGGMRPVIDQAERVFGRINHAIAVPIYGAIIATFAFLFRKKLLRRNPADIILLGFLLYMISEYIIPAGRGAYTLVQWVFPILLMLQQRRVQASGVVLLIAGLCLVTDFPTFLPFFNDIGELLLVVTVINYIRQDDLKPLPAL